MKIFIKTQVILIVGSMIDFLITFLLADVFDWWYVTGNAAGNIAGALTQFVLSRNLVFITSRQGMPAQLIKFVLMWMGNIILSAIGIYSITRYFHLHCMMSKLIISVLLGVGYTYLLSKKFVFR